MPAPFGLRFCATAAFSRNAFDAIGRDVELNQSDAAIEGFAVAHRPMSYELLVSLGAPA